MRAKEFIIEREMPRRKSDVMTTTYEYPQMTSANAYDMYRFGMAMADHENTPAEGVLSNHGVITAYTPEEDVIIKHAERVTGHKGKLVADRSSHEPGSTNTLSPVAKKKPNKYGV